MGHGFVTRAFDRFKTGAIKGLWNRLYALGLGMAKQRRDQPSWLRFSGIGIEYASAVAVFALLGYWIDRHYGCRPWGLVIGAVLGLIGGTYNLVRQSLSAFQPPGGRNRPKDDEQPGQR